jgi:hypothetical protein
MLMHMLTRVSTRVPRQEVGARRVGAQAMSDIVLPVQKRESPGPAHYTEEGTPRTCSPYRIGNGPLTL